MRNHLHVVTFGQGDPLDRPASKPAAYLRRYLADLGVRSIVIEPDYFDRDYLAECAAFYAVGARFYGNRCERLHFFARSVDDALVDRFLAGDPEARDILQHAYCGFSVVRPIPHAPWGRTVLAWYPPREGEPTRRITNPSRTYKIHIAGIELTVEGLAWQQQDTGVGSCSTVALWSALQSSAFDPYYAIPTTTAVTLAGNQRGTFGRRVFPSRGMHVEQLGEAIKELGLAPAIFDSDRQLGDPSLRGFSPERFSLLLATLLRSGYPVVMGGYLETADGPQGHAVCAVGFRSASESARPKDEIVAHEDSGIGIVYVHDDNIGPNVRCRLSVGPDGLVRLQPEAPKGTAPSVWPDPCLGYPLFRPTALIAAVHHEMRMGADRLAERALTVGNAVAAVANLLLRAQGMGHKLWIVQTQFMRQPAYLGPVLGGTLPSPTDLGPVRRRIIEEFEPMSLHVGVMRFGRGLPELDVIFDTTGCDGSMQPFFHVAYTSGIAEAAQYAAQGTGIDLGPQLAVR